MPRYRIRDNETGRTMVVRGDSPPTEQEAAELFAQQSAPAPAASAAPATPAPPSGSGATGSWGAPAPPEKRNVFGLPDAPAAALTGALNTASFGALNKLAKGDERTRSTQETAERAPVAATLGGLMANPLGIDKENKNVFWLPDAPAAALTGALNAATLGLSNRLLKGVEEAFPSGTTTPQEVSEKAPVSSVAGTVAGTVAGGGPRLIAKGISKIPALAAPLAARGGSFLSRLGARTAAGMLEGGAQEGITELMTSGDAGRATGAAFRGGALGGLLGGTLTLPSSVLGRVKPGAAGRVEGAFEEVSNLPDESVAQQVMRTLRGRLTDDQREVIASMGKLPDGEEVFEKLLVAGRRSSIPGQQGPLDIVATEEIPKALDKVRELVTTAGRKYDEALTKANESGKIVDISDVKQQWSELIESRFNLRQKPGGGVEPAFGPTSAIPREERLISEVDQIISNYSDNVPPRLAVTLRQAIDNVIDVGAEAKSTAEKTLKDFRGRLQEKIKSSIGEEFAEASDEYADAIFLKQAFDQAAGQAIPGGRSKAASLMMAAESVKSAAGSRARRMMQEVRDATGVDLVPLARAARVALELTNPEQARRLASEIVEAGKSARFGPVQTALGTARAATTAAKRDPINEAMDLMRQSRMPPRPPRTSVAPQIGAVAGLASRPFQPAQPREEPVRDRSGRIIATVSR